MMMNVETIRPIHAITHVLILMEATTATVPLAMYYVVTIHPVMVCLIIFSVSIYLCELVYIAEAYLNYNSFDHAAYC